MTDPHHGKLGNEHVLVHLQSYPVFDPAPSPVLITTITQIVSLPLPGTHTQALDTLPPLVYQAVSTALTPTWLS